MRRVNADPAGDGDGPIAGTATGSRWPEVLAVFDALSRQGRLAVFRSIVRSGNDGVDALALTRELHTTGSALTLHLRRLADAGLIRPRGGRAGRFVADLSLLKSVLALFEGEDPSA